MRFLKQCPFCGSEAKMQHTPNKIYWVTCKNDKCSAEMVPQQTVQEALTLWNTRYGTQDL
jgi:Lar family restriction alleviation protein